MDQELWALSAPVQVQQRGRVKASPTTLDAPDM